MASEPVAEPVAAPVEPPVARAGGPERRLGRWAAGLSLSPIVLWFGVATLAAPEPAWHAEYRDARTPDAAPSVVFERELQRYWDRSYSRTPGGIEAKHVDGRWQACLALDAPGEFPVLLVADGVASLSIDGTERWRAEGSKERVTRGELLQLAAGRHLLEVQLRARRWPSIALLASFDGAAPKAIGSGELAPGVRSYRPEVGGDGRVSCPER